MKEQTIEEELGKLGILIDTEFTARIVKVHEVFYRQTNSSDGSVEGYFETFEDASNLIGQLRGYAESREVLVLKIDDQLILLSKMEQIELQPAGSVPYLSPEEQKMKSQEKIGRLIEDMEKKMSIKKPELTKEEIDCLFEGIGQK
ncbi:MAG: hypothetical protein Q7T50_00555 [Candidatus Magasanikbacteria bacterium]|nr:hypothetical protein [Candidatus Magasanikbacteria bacterium]